MSANESQLDFEKIGERILQDERDSVKSLELLLKEINAESSFLTFVFVLLTRWAAEKQEGNKEPFSIAVVELAAFHLYPFFGINRHYDAGKVRKIVELIEHLKELRSQKYFFCKKDEADPALDIFSHIQVHLENIRSTNYLTQIMHQIRGIQGPFEEWFTKRIGIGPSRALDLLKEIQQHWLDNSLRTLAEMIPKNSSPEPHFNEDELYTRIKDSSLEGLPVSLEGLRTDCAVTEAEWSGLLNLIGFDSEARSTMSDPIQVQTRPLFVLPNKSVVLIDLSSAVTELFYAFERVAKEDQRFWDKKYQQNQKNWMEEEVGKYLKGIFPPDHVFTQLHYPDPERTNGVAELDCAVTWGPFLLLIEVKGRQFRLHKASTDFRRLRTDLKQNVQDAFVQAKRAAQYVRGREEAIFKEKNTNREMKIRGSNVRRIFEISVTLHHLADFATQLANLKSLNLFPDNDYPFSVSLADLDLICRFSGGPDVFLHYVHRRIELQRSEKNIMADELDLFGTYLDTRLEPSFFWDREPENGERPFTLMIITGGSEKFDQWHNHLIGLTELAPMIKLQVPTEIIEFLAELRMRADDGARWIAFSLLNLSKEGVQRFARIIQTVRNEPLPPGQQRSALFEDKDFIAVITIGRMVALKFLNETMMTRVMLEKYRRKAEFALGFAIELNDPFRVFISAFWSEGEWHRDSEVDRHLANMPSYRLRPGQRKPQPNEPCLCGSSRKFKNCCSKLFS